MKASKTALEGLSDMESVSSNGDIRRIVATSLLALVRKEISATDVEALAKGLDAISNNFNAEIRVAKAAIELREKGGDIGKVSELGRLQLK